MATAGKVSILAVGLVLLFSGCDRYRVEYFSPVTEAETVRVNHILTARIRRTQVIAEIARLNSVLRTANNVENRIVLESMLDERRTELLRLNVLLVEQ